MAICKKNQKILKLLKKQYGEDLKIISNNSSLSFSIRDGNIVFHVYDGKPPVMTCSHKTIVKFETWELFHKNFNLKIVGDYSELYSVRVLNKEEYND